MCPLTVYILHKYINLCSDESDLQHVMREVTSLAERWQELGTSLGINKSQLETICFDSPIDCLRKTLMLWLKQSYEV